MRTCHKLVKRDGSPYYYITWTEDGKSKRRSTGYTDRPRAEKFFANFILEIESPRYQTQKQAKMISLILEYETEHANRTLSERTIKYNLDSIKKFFGNDRVSDLTRSRVREYIDLCRKQKLADGTIRRHLTTLTALLNYARKEGKLDSVPYIEKPSSSPPREKWLSKEEAEKLLDACIEDHIRIFMLVALYTGQRKRAILELQWSKVNFDSGMIDFSGDSKRKTTKRRVMLPMNPTLYAELKKAKEKTNSLYVVSFRGNQIKGDILMGFYRVVVRSGIAGKPKEGQSERPSLGVSPHTLRHTAATWMALEGIDLFLIAKVLGQSVQRTTELYAKFHPEHLRRAVDAIGKYGLISAKTLPVPLEGNK